MKKLIFIIITFLMVLMFLFLPYKIDGIYDGVVFEGDELDMSLYHVRLYSVVKTPFRPNVQSSTTKDGYHLSADWGYLHTETDVPIIQRGEVEISYTGTLYAGDVPKEDDFHAKVTYENGVTETLSITFPDFEPVNETTKITLGTVYGDSVVTLTPIDVVSVSAEYDGDVLVGDAFDKSRIQARKTYADGKTVKTDFMAEAPETFEEDCEIKVMAAGKSCVIPISPVPVAKIHATGNIHHKSGELPGIEGITIIYENGTVVDVDRRDVRFRERLNVPLKEGSNEYHFEYRGKEYSFEIKAAATTLVEDALKAFRSEAETADYKHISDSIFVTVTKHETADSFYFLSHIVINDPSQLQSGLSYDDYGGERELPTNAAKRLNWVIGTNGSNFDYATGKPEYAGVCIKNRQVMDGTRTNGMEICLMANGVLFSPDAGVDPYKLIASDVIDSWSCGDTLLIDDGPVNVGIQSEQYRYPRTAIGMVQPCEYYLITAGSGGYEGGMTYDEVRNVLLAKGCRFGKCMDGGGSSSLVFEGKLLNTPAVNEERPVVDFLYFTE